MTGSNQRSWRLKEAILKLLREHDTYCSGSKIGRITGVSRAAVWKAINQLRGEGHQILGRTHLGYKLEREADILSKVSLEQAIQACHLDDWLKRVVFKSEAESTNTMARHAAEAPYTTVEYAAETPHLNPEIFVARQQNGGRGRRGRKWLSDPEGSLTFSLLLRPGIEPKTLSAITLLAGLCTARALNDLIEHSLCTGHSTDNISKHAHAAGPVGIKWPNDLVDMISGRKMGGLLTEMLVEENRVDALIIGIGLNINNQDFPREIESRATSILKAVHCRLLRVDVLCRILIEIRNYEKILAHPKLWLDEYRAHCLTLGRFIDIHHANGSVESALAVDIDSTGALIIENKAGQRALLHSGEVSVRETNSWSNR
jgi:BirA family transcriptional regulator, biotin operon repressor / biotin---[acetyl-CoA-carboxylase] ligase